MRWLKCTIRPDGSRPACAAAGGLPRCLPVGLLLAVGALAVPPAQAQITLVSNTHTTKTSDLAVGQSPAGQNMQRFTTGSHMGGYHLSSVGIRIQRVGYSGSETVRLKIYEFDTSADKNRGSLVHALTTPSPLRETAVNAFAAPAGAILLPDTQYLLEVVSTGNASADLTLGNTTSNAETGEAGWKIENVRRVNGNHSITGASMMMNVKGSPIPIEPRFTATLKPFDEVETPDGTLYHRLDVELSEPVAISPRNMREHAFNVTNGTIEKAMRIHKQQWVGVDGQRKLLSNHWRLEVHPTDPDSAVTVELKGVACGEQGGMCSQDGLSVAADTPPLTMGAGGSGLITLSIADGTGAEDDGEVLFDITLSRSSSQTVRLRYRTIPGGTATEDVDYWSLDITDLLIPAGNTIWTVGLTLRDDSINDAGETVRVEISQAQLFDEYGEVIRPLTITRAVATGTISNSDPLPRALLSRFARAAAVHVVEHVEERIEAPREPGFRGRVAGRELRRGREREMALGFLRQLGAGATGYGAGVRDSMGISPASPAGSLGTRGIAGGLGTAAAAGPLGAMSGPIAPLGSMSGPAGPLGAPSGPQEGRHGGGLLSMGLGGGDVLTGSAFSLNRETRQGGILSFWSRGARSHFSGQDGALALGGDVRTTMFGADYAKGPLVAGLSLSHSRGLGEYAGVSGGQVASAVTGLYPWLGYEATERVTVWGVAGYGTGGMLLTPDGGPALESGLSMAMAAAGTRGELVAGGASGFELAFKSDVLWVGTSIDGVDGPAGRLTATAAAVTRFRTGLEGSRAYTLPGRLSLRPSVEVGLRHDGGDAETGAGMDLGAGLVVSDASTGLAVDVRVRTLVVHQAEGFRERGAWRCL